MDAVWYIFMAPGKRICNKGVGTFKKKTKKDYMAIAHQPSGSEAAG